MPAAQCLDDFAEKASVEHYVSAQLLEADIEEVDGEAFGGWRHERQIRQLITGAETRPSIGN
jgi:hypothetical protein